MKKPLPIVAAAVALGITAGGLSLARPVAADPRGIQQPAAPAAGTGPAPVIRATDSVAEAQAAAGRQGYRVEIRSARSETTTTYANPDGTFTTEVSSGPVRVRDAAQPTGWAPLDLTLRRRSDGGAGATRHPQALRLSGARGTGSSDLASLTVGAGQSMTMGWPGKLPEPQLSGDDATYRDVQPGVDLVVRATATGFEQFVILKKRQPYTVSLPLRVKGLTAAGNATGGVTLTDSAGKLRGAIAAPTAWDASVDPRAGGSTNTRPVAMGLTGGKLTLTPDAAWLADPATRYPVTIDPSTTIKPASDTWVETDYASAQAGSTELRVGTYDGGSSIARSFLSFNTAAFAGKSVTSASLKLYQFHSWSCSARSYQVWETGAFTTSTTWTNQPAWTKQYASISSAHGYTGCVAGVDSISVTSLAQHWATEAAATRSLGLRAGSETDSTYWKKFNSANASSNQPTLSVTYNSYPNTAGTPTHTPGTASATTTTGWTTTATPTLKATVSDPDGGSVKALFDVYNGSTLVVSHLAGTSVTSGGTSTAVVPAGKLVNGTQYLVRAWSNDGTLTSAAATTGYDRLTVDTSAPAAPSITSVTFPAGVWTDASGLGSDGKAHFTAKATSTDAKTLRWALDSTSYTTSATVAGTATAVDIAIAPPAVGSHTLRVQTVDTAGNVGAAAAYTFFYGAGPLAVPATTSASPVDSIGIGGPVDLVMTDTPTLSAAVGPNVGSTVDYDFELWDGAQTALLAATSVTGVADGGTATWRTPSLSGHRDYSYRVRGRAGTKTGPWSAWRRLVQDRPEVPTALLATGTDTAKPILSAAADRPSGRDMTMRYYLWDQAGNPLGSAPYAEVEASSGVRTSVALPTGLVATGASAGWAVAACVGDVCSAQSARQTFTVTTPAAPATQRVTIPAADWATAGVDPGECDAGTCPLQAADLSLVGGDEPNAGFVRFTGLDAIPAGAQVADAQLQLGAADCGGADCGTVTLDLFPIMSAWPDPAPGEQLWSQADLDDGITQPANADGPDVSDLLTQWLSDGTVNGGLALAVDQATDGTVQFGAAPTLVVDYVPAGVPSAPRGVTARAGDGGVLVDWGGGTYLGTDPEATTFTIAVTDKVTGAVTNTTTSDGPVIVHGLTDGHADQVTVTAAAGGGNGPASAPVSFTPAAPDTAAQSYLDAVDQYHQVTDAATSEGVDPAAPLAGLSGRDAVAAAVLARSAVLEKGDDTLERHDITPQDDAWTAQDTLVSAGPDGTVTVRVYGKSVTGAADADPADISDAETVEDFQFTGGNLSAVVDATDTDQEPSLDDGRVADLDPQPQSLALDAEDGSDDPTPIDVDDDGMPVQQSSGPTVHPLVNSNGVDHGGVASYAVNHAYDKPPRVFKKDDCTDFASKALHTGGKLPFRYGWYQNNKHWWSNSFNRTYSWGGVINLSIHLGYRNVTWVRYTNQAVPGDILFWKYREWKNIGHTSVITKQSGWTLWYSQHSGPRRNQKLQDMLAVLNAQGHGPVTIYIAHLGNR